MPEQVIPEIQPLSQTKRVVNAFVAPSRTFHDVRRSASWWLPFLLLVLASYLMTTAVRSKVGWPQLVQNEIRANPKLSERLASLPPEQVATQQRAMVYSFSYGFYAGPLINLAALALTALVLWATINFAFGGDAVFSRVFCVTVYAALPGAIAALLAALTLFAGRDPSGFTTQTLVGSNLGYYLDASGALKTLLTSLDVFSLWTAVLLSMGLAIVAHARRSAGYISVFGWFALIVLARTAIAAMNS